MSDELLNFLFFAVVLGPPLIIGALIFRAFRAGPHDNAGEYEVVNTLPYYNTNGTPMIPGSSFDVTGSPYGSESRF